MLIKASANGRLEDTIRGEGGIDSLVWDGESPNIDIQIVNESIMDERYPDFYELTLNRLGKAGSYEINELLSKNQWINKSDTDKPIEYFRRDIHSTYFLGSRSFNDPQVQELSQRGETFLSALTGPFVREG
ncbi:SMC domain protein, partial [Candidatus Magnetobacterium bavaricum]